MRKLFTVLFVLFYFVLSTGITANVHFCKNKFHSVQLFKCDNSYSCCKKGKMKKGCCKNVHVSFKKNSEEKINQITEFSPFQIALVPDTPEFYIVKTIPTLVRSVNNNYFQPPRNSIYPRIHIMNCVYLI
jgi:hypothetical protein